ncbi:hypothetical protein THTE_2807 [Thermogutta terrifontis]|uniref:Uncharacterized protein n=1 Tax=Thermogutta terrifontis TaxID=1331910 RepID=A0A286RHH4_9BACT|nr:hypothetical protein THTE_2807 [Thermogutta terrifontis]
MALRKDGRGSPAAPSPEKPEPRGNVTQSGSTTRFTSVPPAALPARGLRRCRTISSLLPLRPGGHSGRPAAPRAFVRGAQKTLANMSYLNT